MTTNTSERVWQALAAIAVVCLSLITLVVVRREFFTGDAVIAVSEAAESSGSAKGGRAGSEPVAEAPVPVDDWARVSGAGHRIGPADAPVTIVVFSDFQCPYCARFATQTFPSLQGKFPGQVAMLFRHWPLPGHPNSYPAAKAAECAAKQGRFEQFHNALFGARDSLGRKSYVAFAKEAGVKDLGAFERCANAPGSVAAIDADALEARRVGGRGTPTIVINGLRIRPPYSPTAIADHIRAALAKAKA